MTKKNWLPWMFCATHFLACSSDEPPLLFSPADASRDAFSADQGLDVTSDDAHQEDADSGDGSPAPSAFDANQEVTSPEAALNDQMVSDHADAGVDGAPADAGVDGARSDAGVDGARGDTGVDACMAGSPVDDPRAVIRSVTLTGDLCAPGTTATGLSPDGEAATVVFSSTLVGTQPPTGATCRIVVEMDVPPGYQIGAPRVVWQGTGTNTFISRRYSYLADPSSSPTLVDNVAGDFTFADAPVLWSPPSCSAPQPVRFVSNILGLVANADDTASVYSFDIVTAWRSGVEWRHGCTANDLIQAPPALAGEWCGGPHARSCGCSLGCEYDLTSNVDNEGLCVDASEVVPARGLDERCGGLRHIDCDDDLVCWEPTQAAIDNQWLGRCAARLGAVDATCQTGIPALPCESSLFCALESHRCVQANGELDSLCGDGLPDCRTNLRCNGTRCVVPRTP